jgi:glycosyltransferase involved in cell wall biosynthesis
MEKKIKFVTLFCYKIQNVHLTKDIGMIPFMFFKTLKMDSELVTIENKGEIFKSIKNEVIGLKLTFISSFLKIPFTNIYFSAIIYLLRNSKSINILNIYHLDFSVIITGLIYKIINPMGTLYVKLDLSSHFIRELFIPKTRLVDKLKLKIRKWYLSKIVSLVSYENQNIKDVMIDLMPEISKKIIYVPNGIDPTMRKRVNKFSEKENIIINVGRIGSYQKNTELLLSSLTKLDLKNWKVYFIGAIEDSFNNTINNFFRENPTYSTQIFFTGNIEDRDKLFDFYNRAKVFCLTSRWEGFPLVFPEAIYARNFIITTEVGGALDITNNGLNGKIIKDDIDLIGVLQELINGEVDLKTNYHLAKEHSANFIWTEIIRKHKDKFLNTNCE